MPIPACNLKIELTPSQRLLYGYKAVLIVTCVLLVFAPLTPWLRLLALCLLFPIGYTMYSRYSSFARVTRLERVDGEWALDIGAKRHRHLQLQRFHVLPFLVLMRFCLAEPPHYFGVLRLWCWRYFNTVYLPLMSDSTDTDSFRRLRVLLRTKQH